MASKKMAKGTSKFQIENTLKNMSVDDIDDNFVGVFPSNHMKKFIDHAAMISEKKEKYPFVIANTDSSEKGGHTGAAYLILSQNRTFSSLILLD